MCCNSTAAEKRISLFGLATSSLFLYDFVIGKIGEWRKGKFYIFLMLIMYPTSKREHQVFIKHILILKTVLPSVLKFRINLKFLADMNAQSATKPSIVMLLCL